MLHLGELAVAAPYRLPVTICLFNDRGYGVLRRIEETRFGGRRFGVDLATPDVPALARTHGRGRPRGGRRRQAYRAAPHRLPRCHPGCMGSTQRTSSGSSTAGMSRFTTTGSWSLQTRMQLSG